MNPIFQDILDQYINVMNMDEQQLTAHAANMGLHDNNSLWVILSLPLFYWENDSLSVCTTPNKMLKICCVDGQYARHNFQSSSECEGISHVTHACRFAFDLPQFLFEFNDYVTQFVRDSAFGPDQTIESGPKTEFRTNWVKWSLTSKRN